MKQLSIFEAVTEAFAQAPGGELSLPDLYAATARISGIDRAKFSAKTPIGRSGKAASLNERTARFAEQTLKMRGLLERTPNQRGTWRLTTEGKRALHRIERGVVLIGFSTELGVALWSDCRDAFAGLVEPVHLILTSPPYALAKPRAYGNPERHEYLDFICATLEPLVKRLAPGASLILNVGTDLFEKGSPARCLLQERLTLALVDRLGLHLMDRLVWHNPTKPPGPVQWASLRRVQLNVAWEPLLWFTNDPAHVRSDNRRVLLPHTEKHLRFVARGGTRSAVDHCDGRYARPAGAFSLPTDGRIPRNVLTVPHRCSSQSAYKKLATAAGLPAHGAPMPAALADFCIRFLSEPGDLVADPFGGSQTTAVVAERLGRRWVTAECMAEYVAGGALRFPHAEVQDSFSGMLAS